MGKLNVWVSELSWRSWGKWAVDVYICTWSSLRWERRSVVSLVDELQGVKLIRMLHLADIMSWDAADCCYY